MPMPMPDEPAPEFQLGETAEHLADETERWPAQMAEIAAFAAHELHGARPALGEAESRRLGARVAVRLCAEMGGSRYYWPKGDAFERVARDLRIAAEHDGTVDGANGIRTLAKRYNMTDVMIWRIISRERERWLARVQGKLEV